MLNGKDSEGNQIGQSSITIINIDKELPIVTYGTNGATDVQIASTKVTVSDTGGSGIDTSKLQYIWDTQNTVEPTGEWKKLVNGESLTQNIDGTYYLWVKGADRAGNEVIDKSNVFDLYKPENPVITANPTEWINGNVTATITYSKDCITKEYSFDGITWQEYILPIVVTENNVTIYAKRKR